MLYVAWGMGEIGASGDTTFYVCLFHSISWLRSRILSIDEERSRHTHKKTKEMKQMPILTSIAVIDKLRKINGIQFSLFRLLFTVVETIQMDRALRQTPN